MNEQLSQQQMNALLGKNDMTSGQSAAALGHSNSFLSNMLGRTKLEGSTDPAVAGMSKGSLSGLGSDLTNLLPTAGAIAGGIGGATLGIPGGPAGVYAGGVAGAGLGGAAGEAGKEALQGSKLSPGAIAGAGGTNAALDAVGGPILSAGGKFLEGVAKPAISALGRGASRIGELFGAKGATEAVENVVRPPVRVATSRLSSTEETMTKGERESAIDQGRMTPNGKYLPSKTEQRAGELMQGKTYSNPVKTVKAVKDEIASRGQAAETHLEQNSKKISNKEDYDAFQSAKTRADKYMTPAESGAYDEQIGVFQKILKGYSGDGGYTTANYYKALKDYESNVTANLAKGKDALLTPGGSARIQGAKDVREVVRDMIGQKNPEFKGEMYDLASLYDAKDNVISRAEQGGHSLAKRYPKTATAIGTAATLAGVDELKNLTGL